LWRRMLSDSKLLNANDPNLIRRAWSEIGGYAPLDTFKTKVPLFLSSHSI
jgi:hypothetical protein